MPDEWECVLPFRTYHAAQIHPARCQKSAPNCPRAQSQEDFAKLSRKRSVLLTNSREQGDAQLMPHQLDHSTPEIAPLRRCCEQSKEVVCHGLGSTQTRQQNGSEGPAKTVAHEQSAVGADHRRSGQFAWQCKLGEMRQSSRFATAQWQSLAHISQDAFGSCRWLGLST